MAMHAHPLPLHPYSPVSDLSDSQDTRYPSPFVPIRLPVFALVIWLNDWVVRLISVGAGGGGKRALGQGRGLRTSTRSADSRSERAELAEVGEGEAYETKQRAARLPGSSRKRD